MTYQVIWEDSALAELHGIWQVSIDKDGIQQVAKRIDIELTHNPRQARESRHEDFRVLFKYPLVVWFRVLERMQMVQVLHVRLVKR